MCSRVCRSLPPIEGFLDDYAFAVRGLLDLHAACQDEKWLKWAEELQSKQDELFWDEREGAYFSSAAGDPNILIRLKDGFLFLVLLIFCRFIYYYV